MVAEVHCCVAISTDSLRRRVGRRVLDKIIVDEDFWKRREPIVIEKFCGSLPLRAVYQHFVPQKLSQLLLASLTTL